MDGTPTLSWIGVGMAYAAMIVPMAIIMFLRVKIMSGLLLSLVRMTVQLLFVGVYLKVVFELNYWWLTLLWLMVMLTVADLSIITRCSLRIRPFIVPLLIALLTGTALPALYLTSGVLHHVGVLDAAYFIPLAGMIAGNCLRASVIGIDHFYRSVREKEALVRHDLAMGATISEAVRPHVRLAIEAALSPTIATMATIGLVALPGMMTGIILGGTSPMAAIKYQIVIMVAIFTGTTLDVVVGIVLTRRRAFSAWGTLNHDIYRR